MRNLPNFTPFVKSRVEMPPIQYHQLGVIRGKKKKKKEKKKRKKGKGKGKKKAHNAYIKNSEVKV